MNAFVPTHIVSSEKTLSYDLKYTGWRPPEVRGEVLKPACGDCYYFTFVGLQKACGHPKMPRRLVGGPAHCKLFVDLMPKVAHGEPHTWETKLTCEELKEII